MESQRNLDEDSPAFNLTEKDRENLARKDEDFEPHTWDNLKQIIGTVNLSAPDVKLTRSSKQSSRQSTTLAVGSKTILAMD